MWKGNIQHAHPSIKKENGTGKSGISDNYKMENHRMNWDVDSQQNGKQQIPLLDQKASEIRKRGTKH